jgi:chromosome segregation ATPase
MKMEPSKASAEAPVEPDAQGAVEAENRDRVLKFSNSFKDRNGGGERGDQPKRDWSSAIDLVNEAFEAIRLADERAVAAENYHQQLIQHHKEQVRSLESRITAAEKRAEGAEGRLKEAESWLARFHDTIVDGFQRTFTAK